MSIQIPLTGESKVSLVIASLYVFYSYVLFLEYLNSRMYLISAYK